MWIGWHKGEHLSQPKDPHRLRLGDNREGQEEVDQFQEARPIQKSRAGRYEQGKEQQQEGEREQVSTLPQVVMIYSLFEMDL